MTSREFIQRQLGNADGKTRSLSSVYKDQNGQIYSYYHHYPLVFEVAGIRFRNTRGYSSTTGKHLSWCYDMADVDVVLTGCNQYSYRNPENKNKVPYMLYERANGYSKPATDRQILKAIQADLQAELNDLRKQMEAKKRKDTSVFADLERQFDKVRHGIATVKAAL